MRQHGLCDKFHKNNVEALIQGGPPRIQLGGTGNFPSWFTP
jgi:hypothetical protein